MLLRLEAAIKHNAEQPIARLPLDILLIIFSILSSDRKSQSIDQPPPMSRVKPGNYDLGWITVTHVCQCWRRVALCDPTLWAASVTIPFPLGKRWAAVFLARAQDAPLTIISPEAPSLFLSPAELAFIGDTLTRLRVLCLSVTNEVLPVLCAPAPLLHTLRLNICHRTYLETHTVIPANLLGGLTGAPALRHLCIRTCGPPPWTSPLLASLVSLNIGHVQPGDGFELRDMLDALGRMRVLELLVLQLNFNTTGRAPHPVVPLVTLRRLCTIMSAASARHVLAHLKIPMDARVECTVLPSWRVNSAYTPADLDPLFLAMTACVGADAAPITRIDVFPSPLSPRLGSIGVDVVGWRGEASALVLRLTAETVQELYQCGLVPCALRALASEHLTELAVWWDEPDSAWPHALGQACHLHRVIVTGTAVLRLCAALDDNEGLLPALSVLILQGMDFSSGWLTSDGQECTVGAVLPRWLARRARAGLLPKELNLCGCSVDDACACRLREAVLVQVLEVRPPVGTRAET
ncbi:hypothetical protein FA95DRAFT_948518 [Auriscalpium vulgare]|uniref:Uncharacterized protein n=1 Tax=Auriscalpium vulgare TaxID=40419 RepID=A0ACB8RYB5_9AGAM|nr:hypothetical protein FA95DRAFT_948518 [Auriscalpium vulgare]